MAETLALPFPLLSDPDGTRAIQPYGAWHEGKGIARPAVIVTTPGGDEALHQVGEDFADRPDEDELVERISRLGLPPVRQTPPPRGHPDPGQNAVDPRSLTPYFRGAKMAVTALVRAGSRGSSGRRTDDRGVRPVPRRRGLVTRAAALTPVRDRRTLRTRGADTPVR